MQGVNSWVKAGEIIAEEIDNDEGFKDELCEAKGLSPEIVDRFYALGKKLTFAPLLIMEGPGTAALLKCPYALQERHSSKPVEVLIRKENGWDSLRVEVQNLTAEQTKQVFHNGQIRSIQAQRAFVESRNLKSFNPIAKTDTSYKISGKKVIIGGYTFTSRDLAKIIAEIEQ